MEYRDFGKTGFKSSAIGFGSAAIAGEGAGYGFGEISEKDALGLISAALDAGINLFDSAPIYGYGLSEKRLGMGLKANRDECFIVSKCGVDWHENRRVNMTNEPEVCEKMLHQSLKDLQTDYIDLYMVHWPDPRVDIRKTMEVLARAQEQDKIRFIGLCNTNQSEINLAREICHIDAYQSEFNLFNHTVKEEIFSETKEAAFMSWGTLDKGILTGRVNKNRKFDKDDCRSWAPWWKTDLYRKRIEKMEKVLPLLKEKGIDPVSHALNWVLSHKEVSTALCGFKSPAQMESLISCLDNDNLEIYNETVPLLGEE